MRYVLLVSILVTTACASSVTEDSDLVFLTGSDLTGLPPNPPPSDGGAGVSSSGAAVGEDAAPPAGSTLALMPACVAVRVPGEGADTVAFMDAGVASGEAAQAPTDIPTDLKWDKDVLTYGLLDDGETLPGSSAERMAVNLAITTWEFEIALTLRPAEPGEVPDLRVVTRSDDEDEYCQEPGILGYAWYPQSGPTSGTVVLCDNRAWSVEATPVDGVPMLARTYNLLGVLIHELGHAIGLTHSVELTDPAYFDPDDPRRVDIMWPAYTGALDLSLHDIQRASEKYGARTWETASDYERRKAWLHARSRDFVSRPLPPVQVSAAAGGPGRTVVTWVTVPHADYYEVRWAPSAEALLTDDPQRTLAVFLPPFVHGVDEPLQAGQTYHYAVRGVRREAAGEWSAPTSTAPGVQARFAAASGMGIPADQDTLPCEELGAAWGRVRSIDLRPIRGVTVMVDVAHTAVGELQLYLGYDSAVSGERCVLLSNRRGGLIDNFAGTLFVDAPAPSIAQALAPGFGGAYSPEQPLAQLHELSGDATWTLYVVSRGLSTGGRLNHWYVDLEF